MVMGSGGSQRPEIRPSGCGRAETSSSEVSLTNWVLHLPSLSDLLGRDMTVPLLQVQGDSGALWGVSSFVLL